MWIGGAGMIRSKTRTLPKKVSALKELPDWNYDGSSTNQAPGDNSEVYLVPVKYWPCPFRGGDNIIVLCECVHPLTKAPIPTNTRAQARKIFENKAVFVEKPWYGIEQ